MAETKSTLDSAADSATTWWQWALSFVPEKWKKYVALVMFAIAGIWLLPSILGAVKDVSSYVFASDAVTKSDMMESQSKLERAIVSQGGALVALRERVEALEKKTLTTGSVKKK